MHPPQPYEPYSALCTLPNPVHPFQGCECGRAWYTGFVKKQFGSGSDSCLQPWSLHFFMLFLSVPQAQCPVQRVGESLCWDILFCAWDRGGGARGWGTAMRSLMGCLPDCLHVPRSSREISDDRKPVSFLSLPLCEISRKQDQDHFGCFKWHTSDLKKTLRAPLLLPDAFTLM